MGFADRVGSSRMPRFTRRDQTREDARFPDHVLITMRDHSTYAVQRRPELETWDWLDCNDLQHLHDLLRCHDA